MPKEIYVRHYEVVVSDADEDKIVHEYGWKAYEDLLDSATKYCDVGEFGPLYLIDVGANEEPYWDYDVPENHHVLCGPIVVHVEEVLRARHMPESRR